MEAQNEETEAQLPSFGLLKINDNPNGWGPYTLPEKYRDMPYQPFSKDQRIGKVADWTGSIYQDRRYQNRYLPHLASAGGTQYTYYHDEDESSFQLVDTTKTAPRMHPRLRFQRRGQLNRQWREQQRYKMANPGGGPANQPLSKVQLRARQQLQKKWLKQNRQNQEYQRRPQRQTHRESSVAVQESWQVLEELDFVRLAKLSVPLGHVTQPADLKTCGEMEHYDKTYDRVSTKNERRLQRVNRVIHTVTTSQDPVIRRLAKERKGNLFLTDTILATLMCCIRSNYGWDIVVQKVGENTLIFDKREDSDFDLLTVHETAAEQPNEETGALNSAKNLALEATFINHNFSQQVLRSSEEKFSFEDSNPFVEDEEDEGEIASVGYRYRSWKLGDKMELIVRCEHDAVTLGSNSETQFMTIKALNEFDPRAPGAVDYRSKMDTQRGAVLAAELKNNAFKLAKWTVCSLLAGSDQLKLGYVSRVNPKDSTKHVILGTQQFKPSEFASQINLSMENCWGIFKCIVNLLIDKEAGRYLILKDPNKPMVRLYKIPNNSFESDEEEEDEEESGSGDSGSDGE